MESILIPLQILPLFLINANFNTLIFNYLHLFVIYLKYTFSRLSQIIKRLFLTQIYFS